MDAFAQNVLALVVLLIAGWAVLRACFSRTVDLYAGLVTTWRADPWPLGVQEEDDVHFDFSAGSPDHQADVVGLIIDAAVVTAAPWSEVEELHGIEHGRVQPVPVDPVRSVHVREGRP
jgi:hypothetical protein